MKKSLTFLLLTLHTVVFAQFNISINGSTPAPQETIDTAIVRIGYTVFSISDTTKRDKSTEDYLILEVGSKYSKFYSDNARRRDSLMNAVLERSAGSGNIQFTPELLKSNNIKSGGSRDIIFKNLSENKLTFIGSIARSHY